MKGSGWVGEKTKVEKDSMLDKRCQAGQASERDILGYYVEVARRERWNHMNFYIQKPRYTTRSSFVYGKKKKKPLRNTPSVLPTPGPLNNTT